MNIEAIPTNALFAVCATLECAYESEVLEIAENKLKSWGITKDQAIEELFKRGKDERDIRENEAVMAGG